MKRILMCVFALMFAAAILSGGCGGGNDDPVATDEGQDPTNIRASDFKFTVIYKISDESASATGLMEYTGALSSVDIARADFYATVSNDDGTTYEFSPASEDVSAQAPARIYTMERAYSLTDALALFNQYNGRIYDPRVVMTFADGGSLTIPLNSDNVAFEPASEASEVKAGEIMASRVAVSAHPCAIRCGEPSSSSATGAANIGIPGIMFVVVPRMMLRPRKRR